MVTFPPLELVVILLLLAPANIKLADGAIKLWKTIVTTHASGTLTDIISFVWSNSFPNPTNGFLHDNNRIVPFAATLICDTAHIGNRLAPGTVTSYSNGGKKLVWSTRTGKFLKQNKAKKL